MNKTSLVETMIELDGNYQEGGGALVRVALALSTLTGKEFRVTNIRAGREEGGLKAQHLASINALKEMSGATTNEISVGSTELYFKPGTIKRGTYTIDIGTAGSISLLLQAVLLPSLFAPGKVTLTIIGGTCGKWQASVDYVQNVLLPQLRRFAERIELKIFKRGYFPKGGGKITLEVTPKYKIVDYDLLESLSAVPRIMLPRQGGIEQIRGVVNVSSQLAEKKVAERIQNAAEHKLKSLQVPITVRLEYTDSLSIGGEIVLWAVCGINGKIDPLNPVILGSSVLVEKEKTSEQIGAEAAEILIKEIQTGAAADSHLADQLIPVMGLLPGSSIIVPEVSRHTLTNIYVVEKFLPVKFEIKQNSIYVVEK